MSNSVIEQYDLDKVKDKTDRELIVDVLKVLTNDHEHRLQDIENAVYRIDDRIGKLQQNDGMLIDIYHRIERGLRRVNLM